MKKIYGIGINDIDERVTDDNNRPLNSYNAWHGILQRCYSNQYHKKFPTYIGCEICYDWILLSNFKEWFILNHVEGFDLDKDLLYTNNKIYSPDTCRYIPHALNTLLVDCGNRKGKYPTGVCWCNREEKFRAYCSIPPIVGGNNKHLGYYDTYTEASEARNEFKSKLIIEVGITYYNAGMIEWDILSGLISHTTK